MKEKGIKLVANNKKAYHDYFIEEKYEAGLVLVGTEVKSLRDGKCSIKESYVKVDKGEVYILGMAVGAGGGLIKSVWDKGKDVEIPMNSSFDIVLTQPVTVTTNSYSNEN